MLSKYLTPKIPILGQPPRGQGEGFDFNYYFSVHPRGGTTLDSKKVQTRFGAGEMVIGHPLGQIVNENGQIIDQDDQTSFLIYPGKLSTPLGTIRAVEVTRTEVAKSSANKAIQDRKATAFSAVYDFAFVDLATGLEKGKEEVNQITLKIKVNNKFDLNKTMALISHDPTASNPVWQTAAPVEGTIIFDGQYLSFDLTQLYGQSVVIASAADSSSFSGGGASSEEGPVWSEWKCFIDTAASGSGWKTATVPQRDAWDELFASTRWAQWLAAQYHRLSTTLTRMLKKMQP